MNKIRKMGHIALGAALWIAVMPAAQADTAIGNVWKNHQISRATKDEFLGTYAMGVLETVITISNYAPSCNKADGVRNCMTPKLCPPGPVSIGELGQIMDAYLSKQPANEHALDTVGPLLVITVLASQYPCK